MKKIKALLLAAIFIVCGVMTQTAQAGHYGALRSFLPSGEVSLGFGGGIEHVTWNNKIFKHKVAYGKVNLGLGKEWSLGGLIGAEDLDSVSDTSFASGPAPFVGASVGGPFYRGTILSIGPVLQASYVAVPFKSGGQEVENMMKVSAAMLAQIEVDGASLFFGPTATFGDATFAGQDIEKARCIGGTVGIRWPLFASWPTNQSKTYLDLEIADNDFAENKVDATLELNFTL